MAFPQRLQIFIVLYVGILFIKACESQIQCAKTGTCTCQFDDQQKTIVDFGTIGLNNGQPRFPFAGYGQTGNFLYAFNPCYAFSTEGCNELVSCQKYTAENPPQYFDIGDPNPTTWSTNTDGTIVVTYSSTQSMETRTTSVAYTCDRTALNPSLEMTGEAPTRQYNMVLRTCEACSPAVSGCRTSTTRNPPHSSVVPPPPPPSGITIGGILCIVFTVLLLAYVVAGILFQKFARGATGKEMIPNYGFWSDFPFLVKDGFVFMLSPCRRGGYTDMST